jgi:hypothetical protein
MAGLTERARGMSSKKRTYLKLLLPISIPPEADAGISVQRPAKIWVL